MIVRIKEEWIRSGDSGDMRTLRKGPGIGGILGLNQWWVRVHNLKPG